MPALRLGTEPLARDCRLSTLLHWSELVPDQEANATEEAFDPYKGVLPKNDNLWLPNQPGQTSELINLGDAEKSRNV